MRNGNGTADDQSDIQRVNDFLALPAFFAAAGQVIGDAVIATQNGGGDESEQFLVLGAERTGFVSLMVESEEALDAEVAAAEDFLIQLGAKFLKIFQAICHRSSGGTSLALAWQPGSYYELTRATSAEHGRGARRWACRHPTRVRRSRKLSQFLPAIRTASRRWSDRSPFPGRREPGPQTRLRGSLRDPSSRAAARAAKSSCESLPAK